MDSMIERVARAIDPEIWAVDAPIPTRSATIDFHARRQESCRVARAAIEAMREPTDAITCAIADASPSYTMKDTRIRIWEAAIDAALNEQVAR